MKENQETAPPPSQYHKGEAGAAAEVITSDISVHSESSFDGGHGVTMSEQHAKKQREEIAHRENRLVNMLRLLVFAVLVTFTVLVAFFVNQYLTNQETSEFEAKFESDASKVFESLGRTFDQTLGSTDAMVLQLLQYGKYSSNNNTTWPFVTVPGFPQQAGKLLKLSKAFFCSVAVLVEVDEREQWESYAQNNTWWIGETLSVQAKDKSTKDPLIDPTNSSAYFVGPKIFGFGGKPAEPTPYKNNFLPQWQHYPLQPGGGFLPVNWDNWVVPASAKGINDSLDNKRITIAPPTNIITEEEAAANEQAMSMVENVRNWATRYISSEENNTEPFGSIWVPMYDVATESVQVDLDQEGQEPKAVGFFAYWFFWNNLFRGILSNDSDGIVVVVSNPCGLSFTYRLDGPSETYLGVGDLHDATYDHMGQAKTLNEVMETTKESKEGSSYVGIPLSETHCTHTVHVYPTSDMENTHVTNDPLYFALAAALIFIFTSTVFIVYDCTVARRQRIVMQRALASGAIVQGLFPEAVRNQMYEQQKHEQAKVDAARNFKNFRQDGDENNGVSRPIADHFPDTTVFFADIVGFTAWSDVRTPAQVFELLEALYSSFDKIAQRRGVFKVETIGDSYVAVTGLPNPQKDHAVIMVKFARDCLCAMGGITLSLVDSLGPGTSDLKLRVGLHTGSTTAGVLRGDKGRYQIFGDTVNTASRMESTSLPGRIQVSQATAGVLIEAGKVHWLQEREEMVMAKGKGKMTTYFITGEKDRSTFTQSSRVVSSENGEGDTDDD